MQQGRKTTGDGNKNKRYILSHVPSADIRYAPVGNCSNDSLLLNKKELKHVTYVTCLVQQSAHRKCG
jgi:hypothetical protein